MFKYPPHPTPGKNFFLYMILTRDSGMACHPPAFHTHLYDLKITFPKDNSSLGAKVGLGSAYPMPWLKIIQNSKEMCGQQCVLHDFLKGVIVRGSTYSTPHYEHYYWY